MARRTEVNALPGLVAMDALTVLGGERRGTSVQLTDRYFQAQEMALATADGSEFVENRLRIVRESREVWEEIHIDFPSLTTENLRTASDRFRDVLERVPEVRYLQRSYPEACFVVPEWFRIDGEVKYGARVYFFRDDPPDSGDLIDRNIDATVQDDRHDFERYQGQLHDYPECCIDFFRESDRFDGEQSLEARSLDALDNVVDEARVREGSVTEAPIEDLLPGFFESPQAYAFFAHGFYPEPGCETARKRGVRIYETLTEDLPEPLVRDYFRVNYGWSVLKAGSPPDATTFGRAHCLSFLPLEVLLSVPRYR